MTLILKSSTLKLFSLFYVDVHRPKNVTEVAKCSLVGKPARFTLPEEIKTMLRAISGDSVILHTLQKILRITINGQVYYSKEYKRMKKRISYAVLLQNYTETKFGLVNYFVHDKDSGETYAVMDIPQITDAPPALSNFAAHFIWLSNRRLDILHDSILYNNVDIMAEM